MRITALTFTAFLLATPLAQAQTIDMAEIKCGELTRAYLDQFIVVDAWLSGYYHGKAGTTVVDKKRLAENTQKVMQFCKSNPDVKVMQAVERLASAAR